MKTLTHILMALSLVGTVSVPLLSHAELPKPRQLKLQDNQFVTLTFHDVRDDVAKQGDRDLYAISTKIWRSIWSGFNAKDGIRFV
jgi:hypothetical protein